MNEITLYDTLVLLHRLGYENVRVDALLNTFFTQQQSTKEEELPDLPELPEAPQAPQQIVYKTHKEAKKALKKGEIIIKDDALGGYVNVTE
jgi:hypothetical protein